MKAAITSFSIPSLLSKNELTDLLRSSGANERQLFARAAEIKRKFVGNKVYLRGLIELSNRCRKDCLYCGIRCSNKAVYRYSLSCETVMEAVRRAWQRGFGSVVFQSGEQTSDRFIREIEKMVRETKRISDGALAITLSCGEQREKTYRRWFENGADRYLLRIETASEALYKKLHPQDGKHSFSQRMKALEQLDKIGYQVGTGVMIGLPFQTPEMLADDLLFMKRIDIDMCGMGPYLEHPDTPLYAFRDQLLPPERRFNLGLKMVALLRLLMPDINIAATTALQALDLEGREKAIAVGANVIMPNITPPEERKAYLLYENKPLFAEDDEEELARWEQRLRAMGLQIGYHLPGNSTHYRPAQLRRGDR